jgi:hypothetical protein
MSYQEVSDYARAGDLGIVPICRLTNDGGWGTPAEFAEHHREAIRARAPHCALYLLGNEPNVAVEEWHGDSFAWREWTLQTYRLLKLEFPSLRFAAAALSPTGDHREGPLEWLRQAPALDCWAIHAYWQSSIEEALTWVARFAEGERHVTEYNRVGGPDVPEYVAFLQGCAALGVHSASYFILSGTDDWQRYWLSSSQLAELARPGGALDTPGGMTDMPESMPLAEQFPQQYAEWVAAGGVENNLRKHLLGIGLLAPSAADLRFLADEAGASLKQLQEALRAYPFGPGR